MQCLFLWKEAREAEARPVKIVVKSRAVFFSAAGKNSIFRKRKTGVLPMLKYKKRPLYLSDEPKIRGREGMKASLFFDPEYAMLVLLNHIFLNILFSGCLKDYSISP